MQIIFTVFLWMEQKILIFKLLIIFLLILYSSVSFSEKIIEGKAIIIDGDTIHIGKNKIRLHGIDAPETNQTCTINNEIWNCGIESTIALEKFVLEKKVYCEIIDVDRYKRFVGICFANKININQYMVQNGWAIAYRYYSSDYINDENIAKNNIAGIWQGKFQDPYLFRKQQKN